MKTGYGDVQKEQVYLTVICFVPPPLCVLNITYIMPRKGSIHNIIMDHHCIEAVNRGIVIFHAHIASQVQGLWKSDSFADLPKISRLYT
jgi:hypothetical protein